MGGGGLSCASAGPGAHWPGPKRSLANQLAETCKQPRQPTPNTLCSAWTEGGAVLGSLTLRSVRLPSLGEGWCARSIRPLSGCAGHSWPPHQRRPDQSRPARAREPVQRVAAPSLPAAGTSPKHLLSVAIAPAAKHATKCQSPIDQSHCWFSRRRHCRSPWTTPRGCPWFHSMFSMPRRRPLKTEAAAFSWHFPEPAPRRVRASLPLSRPFFPAAVLAWRHRGVRSRPP